MLNIAHEIAHKIPAKLRAVRNAGPLPATLSSYGPRTKPRDAGLLDQKVAGCYKKV